ncbi:MAG: translation initiation factor IF-2 [Candidatus Omnitrophica bacterium]|nr:translation initiation factor IF-2 [Candidatus Omnitrophota bacterium]
MKVSEVAKELNTSSSFILETLRSLKLKAKGADQELNKVVVSVIKTQLKNKTLPPPEKEEDPVVKAEHKKTTTKKRIKEETKATDADETPVVKKRGRPRKNNVPEETVDPTKPKDEAVEAKKVKEEFKSADAESTSKKKKVTQAQSAQKTSPSKTTSPKAARVKKAKEPIITLKPLGRKRRKTAPREDKKGHVDTKEKPGKEQFKTGSLSAFAHQEQKLAEDSQAKEALKDLEIKVPITVKDLSARLQQKPSMLLKMLMQFGVFAHINQSMDGEIVSKLACEFGYNFIKIKTQEEQLIDSHRVEEEDESLLMPRGPVITFMGHVDHGKTSLLDRIRKSKIVDAEYGGITQHMGAYSVVTPKGRITLLDTPGHEAFTAMRSRSAHITDLVILVVAADEGIRPQTKEAINHARAADVPIVVALNKIDKKNIDPERVKKELAEIDLNPEEWGGSTIVVPVSAMTGQGIDQLLEMVILESELLELKANPNKKASGIVVEAHLSQGRGTVSSLIVQSGTLVENDYIVAGAYYGKVKAMFDDHQRPVRQAGPMMPVEILGLPHVPEAGESFYVVENERQAREISYKRRDELNNKRLSSGQKITLEDLYSHIQEGSIKALNVIMKADVQGSLEALKDSLDKINSDKVKIKFIHLGVGEVNLSDVLLAVASKAVIIAFHVGVELRAKEELEHEPVDVRQYRIIYDAVNDIRDALEGLLEAKKIKKYTSRIEVRQVFKLSKQGIVAGCYVQKGKVVRKSKVDIKRNDEIAYTGFIGSLKRFKDDVKEVSEGMECGVVLNNFNDYQVGDIIEVFEEQTIAQTL